MLGADYAGKQRIHDLHRHEFYGSLFQAGHALIAQVRGYGFLRKFKRGFMPIGRLQQIAIRKIVFVDETVPVYVLAGFGIASPEPSNLRLRRRLIRHDPRPLIPFSAADPRITSAGRARRALLVSYCFVGKALEPIML
jgi:hypothetical protein